MNYDTRNVIKNDIMRLLEASAKKSNFLKFSI